MPIDIVLPRSVRIGGVDKAELLRSLRKNDVRLNRAAETLFEDPRFTTAGSPTWIAVAFRSVADLGFGDGTTYDSLMARARGQGLGECPLELGPHLRLQFLDQPEPAAPHATQHCAPAGSITVASPALDDAPETPRGFYVRRLEGVLWLRGYWADASHVWSPEDCFVFARAGTSI